MKSMKSLRRLSGLFLVVAGLFLFNSCNKDEVESGEVIAKTTVSDYISVINSFSLSTIEDLSTGDEDGLKSATVSDCLTVTIHENDNGEFWPRSWTFDYGTENCESIFGNEKRGMIQPDSIGEPSLETLEEIYSLTGDSLKMMTIAPELDGSIEIIKQLVKDGITASFGHSAAFFEDTIKGIEAGINHVTHLYNAMMPITHRNPGPLPAIFKNNSITAQVIFDGVHIHPSVLKFSSRLLGEKRIIIITDGVQSMGLPDGKYTYNNVEFTSYNGTARYSDGTLIGTCLGMSELIEKYIIYSGGSLRKASRAASYNPARVIGIDDKKGSIEEGKDADIAILNKDLSVWKTIKCGEIIYGEQ